MIHFSIDFTTAKLPESPMYVYHGTRAPAELIRSNGLRFPSEKELLTMIEQAMIRAGLSYEEWLKGQDWKKKKGRLTTLDEIQKPYRQKVWVTDSIENAWSYANRAPEIVSESVRNEIFRLYWRRKIVVNMAEDAVAKSMAGIGQPIVVALDAKKIGARNGCNQPISNYIPPENIVKILTNSPFPEQAQGATA